MGISRYSADGLALARSVLTDTAYLSSVTPEQRADFVGMAMDILRKDRTDRLGPRLIDTTPRVIVIPLAVWQAGPRACRVQRLPPARPTTPGDAA